MPKITFLPMNRTVEVPMGETILEAALSHDIPLQHSCGGYCACTTCHVIVKSGGSFLSEIDEEEQDRMESLLDNLESSRLGCQAKVRGDITVEIQNIDE